MRRIRCLRYAYRRLALTLIVSFVLVVSSWISMLYRVLLVHECKVVQQIETIDGHNCQEREHNWRLTQSAG